MQSEVVIFHMDSVWTFSYEFHMNYKRLKIPVILGSKPIFAIIFAVCSQSLRQASI